VRRFNQRFEYSNNFELDGHFLEPNVHLFSFNNPYGHVILSLRKHHCVDSELVIPNTTLSIYENAIFPERSMGWFRDRWNNNAYKFDFIANHSLILKRTHLDRKQLLSRLNDFFKELEEKIIKYKIIMSLSRYHLEKQNAILAKGKRLRIEASYVEINCNFNWSIYLLNIYHFFLKNLELDEYEKQITKRLLVEINNRLSFWQSRLGYLTLNRNSASLSGENHNN
jgi:excinuclease ABC subunit A